MEEKKILIVNPNQQLVKPFINSTLRKPGFPTNLKFIQLNFEHPEDAEIKNIYRILLQLKTLKTYISIIVLYPKNNPKFKYSNEEFTALNDLLISAGLKNGIVICTLGTDGKLDEHMTPNLKSYLTHISKN
ncbi:MAG: hypothetical protein IPP32_02740 [Bacteroidetes bacterium]|nr:hypothetical protein [Bacteroidota bacterium]